mgnify:FL=1|jgi:hypothetical protein
MEIRTSSFSAVFDTEKNNFTSLCNLATGDEYIKSAPRFPIISVFVWEDGARKELWPEKGAVRRIQEGLVVEYPAFGGRSVRAMLELKADGDRLTVSGQLENGGDADIIEVLLPRLTGIVLGPSHADDVLLYPHHAGERSKNPVRRYRQMADGEWGRHWRAASMPVEDYYRREINYCGLASMSWMYYHDAENGLYIGSHDGRFPVTGVIAETSGDESKPWMGFAFRKHERIRPGAHWNTGIYCVTVSCRDWHYGAEIYREYIDPLLEIQPEPAFLQDEAALHQCYNFKHSGKITRRFADIPAVYEKGAEWGVRHMFMASWNRTGFDSSYPEYYPDMELGSAMAFRRGISYVREKGGFSTLYINARIFDVTSDFHASVGEQMAIRTPEGRMIEEVYGPARFTVNCPDDELWQNYLIDTADFAAMAYGCKGIYLDQLASAEPYACYNEAHSHGPCTGGFNRGYLRILRTLLERLRARDPEAYLMTENCGDIYSAYCWGSLTWNGDTFDEFFNLFKYTFPEYVQVNMVDPRGWVGDPEELRAWFYKDMQRAVLLGSILWLGITDHLERHPAEYRNYARRALAFRSRLQPLFKMGVYADDIFVQDVSEGCDASCWRLEDGRVLLLVGNHALRSGAQAVFRLPGRVAVAEAHDTDWNSVEARVDGSTVTLQLEGERLFCAVVALV